MKYCTKCGKEIMDEAVICPGCGYNVNVKASAEKQSEVTIVPKKAKIASLLGILSILLLAPLGIPSIILAINSIKKRAVLCASRQKQDLYAAL